MNALGNCQYCGEMRPCIHSDKPPEPAQDHRAEVLALHEWLKEGQLARDTGERNPHPVNSIQFYMHSAGWLQRDLQLCLARANPVYRESQIRAGTMTLGGVEGGYGFDKHSIYVPIPIERLV